jgi:hypothetical protein
MPENESMRQGGVSKDLIDAAYIAASSNGKKLEETNTL